ncbi:SMI1/KNR4 family protein [Bisgaard Taxon 46]
MLTLKEVGKCLTEEEFGELEKRINKKLPISMRNFYLKYNGGQPDLNYVHDKKHLFPFNSFYSLDEIFDTLKWFDDDSFPPTFKQGDLLPLAYDPGSGNYAISLKDEDFGKVYFYVLEEEAKIYGVWDSFDEFISSFVNG